MLVIAKTLLLLVAIHNGKSAPCPPMRSLAQFDHTFQYNYYSKSFQSFFQFPTLPQLNVPSYYSTQKPVVDTDSMPNSQYQWQQLTTTTENTIDSNRNALEPKCPGFNATECDEYRKLIDSIFPKDNTADFKSNTKDENTGNNYDVQNNDLKYKGQNGNLITPDTDINSDYETSTDELSFRIPPPYIVAALLGG